MWKAKININICSCRLNPHYECDVPNNKSQPSVAIWEWMQVACSVIVRNVNHMIICEYSEAVMADVACQQKKLTDHVLAYQERWIGCVPICTSRIYEPSLAASIHRPTWRERNNRHFKLFVSLLIIWVRELLKKLGTSCICSWRNLKPTDENRILAKGWGEGARIIGAVKCELPCFASCMAMPRVCGLFALING